MNITFVGSSPPRSGVVAVLAGAGGRLAQNAQALDSLCLGAITRAIRAAAFTGKRDQSLDILVPGGKLSRVVVFGLGDVTTLRPLDIELLGGGMTGTFSSMKIAEAALLSEFPEVVGRPEECAAWLASGARLRAYTFGQYKSRKPTGTQLAGLAIHTASPAKARGCFARHNAVASGVHLARDLVNEPPNRLFPVDFAERVRSLGRDGLDVEILTPPRMRRLGMGALLGVAQGSAQEPRLAIIRWYGDKRSSRPLAFVGKGVTFDSGGISIKPAAGMEDMRGDMAGAACVTGLMLALARRKAKVNAIGAIGLVENMPGANAQRPGDIVTSMSGQTVAVLNTDAEGRLILADVLWYVQQRFKPRFMIDLATLTGAIVVALGKEYAGLFSNSDELAQRLVSAGLATGEKVWRMPLSPGYDKLIDSDVADMKNIGGRLGSSIIAAQFIQRFVNGVPWAHLDIAGTAFDGVRTAISQNWASGWGVRLLNQFVADHYES